MTTEELDQIETALRRELPRVLELEPGFGAQIDRVLRDAVRKRGQSVQLADQVGAPRRDNRAESGQADPVNADGAVAATEHAEGAQNPNC